MVRRREWRVCGRVQGVWFRGATRQQGRRLGVSGVARNRVDGSVQVIAEGSDEALQKLAQWLQVGPEHARVDSVVDIDPPSGETLDDGFYVA
ncbi:MAG: acylphosphatase [Granulosicoccus sp.]|nr:acylphosphatase [Granulosicoccus sp.]